MFGWFKQRLVREHRKLLRQNELAAIDGEIPIRLLMAGESVQRDAFGELREIALRMFDLGVPAGGLTPDEVELALKINKRFREIFDLAYQRGAHQFDEMYTPLGGWKLYLNR